MFKKRVFSLLLAVVLLAVSVVPVAADKPDMYKVPSAFSYPVVDCSKYGFDFWIWNYWSEEDIFHWKYNNDGSLNYVIYQAHMIHTFTAIPDTGKVLVSPSSDMATFPGPDSNYMDIRGSFIKIIIPGVGPIFQDAGRKAFTFEWEADGTISFHVTFNAGPSSYMSMDFSALCAYMAP